MFENLTERLTGVFNRLSRKGRLTDKDIDEALTLVRRSLLEADVNFASPATSWPASRNAPKAPEVLESLTPGQQVVKIVHDELTELLSGGSHTLTLASQPFPP